MRPTENPPRFGGAAYVICFGLGMVVMGLLVIILRKEPAPATVLNRGEAVSQGSTPPAASMPGTPNLPLRSSFTERMQPRRSSPAPVANEVPAELSHDAAA